MKTSAYVQLIAVAAISFAPLAAFARNTDSAQACVKAFVAQSFPDATPSIKISIDDSYNLDSPMPTPIVLSNFVFTMKLSAADATTGQVIASATCTEKRGVLTLTSNSVALVGNR